MNIQRKVIPVTLGEITYDFVLDFESAIEFQNFYGKSIFVGLSKLGEEQDLIALACLIASCLKGKNGKAVGMDFIKQLDLMTSLPIFMESIGELMENSMPKSDDEDKKK